MSLISRKSEQFQRERNGGAVVPAARDRDEVFQHRHFGKQPADLEGARDAEAANLAPAMPSAMFCPVTSTRP